MQDSGVFEMLDGQPYLSSVLTDIIENRRYGVEYQPLISVADGSVYGYEALARFYDRNDTPVSPLTVFRELHRLPLTLFKVEYETTQLQIENFSLSGKLFVNIDPDAYAAVGNLSGADHPLVALLTKHEDLVLEIIENTDISHATISQQMAETFRQFNVKLALDDIGAPDSLLSLPVMMSVDVMKLDKSWLQLCEDESHLVMLKALVDYARMSGKLTVLEGIETEDDLLFARQIGVDLMQGFLFRPQFVSCRS